LSAREEVERARESVRVWSYMSGYYMTDEPLYRGYLVAQACVHPDSFAAASEVLLRVAAALQSACDASHSYYDFDEDPQQLLGQAIDLNRERRLQATWLRDIAGNTFHQTQIDANWLWLNGGTVRRMAQQIYDHQLWSDLPILADALEDGGCSDA